MTQDIERWGDKQQYHAADHGDVDPDQGVLPKVHLQWMTPDPLGSMAMATGMYEGKVFRHLSEVTDDDRKRALDNMMKTHLQAGLEVIRFQFLIDGVDRAFTHQDVRQRTAVFFQESLRFAVLDDLFYATVLPPSLAGTEVSEGRSSIPDCSLNALRESEDYKWASDQERQRALWDYAIGVISEVYNTLVNTAMPAEEARGLLPTAVATRIVHNTDLRNMVGHAGNRLCTQAQFHWRIVYNEMVRAIRNYTPDLTWFPNDTGYRDFLVLKWEEKNRWQYEAIADSNLFRPVCYQRGSCPFNADFDRACTIRPRVEEFAKNGVPSTEWHRPYHYTKHERFYDATPEPVSVTIKPINPAEWLLDPAAART